LKIMPKDPRLETFKDLKDFVSVSQVEGWVRVQIEYEVEWDGNDAVAKGNRKGINALEPSNESGEPGGMPS